jgi:hypothetical protein
MDDVHPACGMMVLLAGVDLVRARKLQELEAYRKEQEVGEGVLVNALYWLK